MDRKVFDGRVYAVFGKGDTRKKPSAFEATHEPSSSNPLRAVQSEVYNVMTVAAVIRVKREEVLPASKILTWSYCDHRRLQLSPGCSTQEALYRLGTKSGGRQP